MRITNNKNNGIIYLEQRVEHGNLINVYAEEKARIKGLYFKYLSYDGFIESKKHNVQLEPRKYYQVRVNRISPGEDWIFCHAMKEISREFYEQNYDVIIRKK